MSGVIGRLAEALDVMKRAARCNKVDINDEAVEKMLMSEVAQKEEKEEVVEVEEEGLLRAFIRYARGFSYIHGSLHVCDIADKLEESRLLRPRFTTSSKQRGKQCLNMTLPGARSRRRSK